jgi:cytochrome c-type biogenesis protein CcmF
MTGRGLLGLAIAFAVYAGVAAICSQSFDRTRRTWTVVRPELLASARRAMAAVCICVAGASAILWYALFSRDFSYSYVAMSTARGTVPWYTFSSFWSGMQGSLLLWSLILSIYGAIFALRRDRAREPFVPWAMAVIAGAELFYLSLAFGPINPFTRLDVVPADGRGLNPLLHSPGMVIHPPMLYTGLIGMTVPFALVVSALINRRTGTEWIRVTRTWALVPFLALGIGLVLGGAWAYTELGWGGYWGWDPVENAALMPWLVITAYLHSAMVQERRGNLRIWNVFLVTLAASLATFGAFLTRSGLLSSVHTFAESPIGKWFFVFLAVQAVGGLAVLVWRLPDLRGESELGSAVSKEATFLVNNLVFVGAAAIVLIGTILPLITELISGRQLQLGPPFFNRVLAPIGAVLLLLATVGTVVPWRRGTLRRITSRLVTPALVALAVGLVLYAVMHRLTIAGVAYVAGLLGATTIVEIVRATRARSRLAGLGTGAAARGLFARNPRRYGGYVVHLGIAIMVIGFAGSIGRVQTERSAKPGDSFTFAGTTFHYDRLEQFSVPDKDVNLAVLGLYHGSHRYGTLRPQLNFHRNWDQPQSEIAIRMRPAGDLYVILAGVDARTHASIFRLHRNPLVFWVWLGAVLAFAGGLWALVGSRRPTTRSGETGGAVTPPAIPQKREEEGVPA